jgi:hypothetical protein
MRSERSQILDLLAARRIDVSEAERLLALVGGKDRFLTLTLCTIVATAISFIDLHQYRAGESLLAALQSTLQSLTGSATFHHLQVFLIRLLGELP